MEYRNLIYYLIYFPSIILLAGFPFYFGIGKSNIGIIIYIFYVFLLTFILSTIQKKYWSWILKKRRKRATLLINQKYDNVNVIEENEYLSFKKFGINLLLKFDFSNYPPYRFSTPKNRLKIYIEKPEFIKDNQKLKIIHINNQDWLYENKIFKDFFYKSFNWKFSEKFWERNTQIDR